MAKTDHTWRTRWHEDMSQIARALDLDPDSIPEDDGLDAILAAIGKVKRDAAREALDELEADTAQVIRTMRERGEQGWARYAIANDILDNHRTRFYPEETP